MKIAAIKQIPNYNKSQNFKGLWALTTRRTDIDPGIGIPVINETSYYFPFSDESEQEINKVRQETENAQIEQGKNGRKIYKFYDFQRCKTLPFTSESYKNYQNFTADEKLTNDLKIIHSFAQTLYTNNNYGKLQTHAENEEVTSALDDEED